MAGNITVRVITPQELAFTLSADEVILSGTNGRFTILPERAPLVAELEAGKMFIRNSDKTDIYYVTSGLSESSDNSVNVMVEAVYAKDKIDAEVLDKKLASLEETKAKQTSVAVIKELDNHIAFIQMIKQDNP